MVIAALGFIPGAVWLLPGFGRGASSPPPMAEASTASAKVVPAVDSFSTVVVSGIDPPDLSVFAAPDCPDFEAADLAFRRWAGAAPAAAAAWLAERADTPRYAAFLEQLALVWANTSPAAATTWAHDLANPADRALALGAVAGELARTEPVDALRIAIQLDPSAPRDVVLRTAIAEWAVHDTDAAVRWAWSISDPRLRQELLAAVILQVAERDPATAAIMAEDDLAPGRARDDVYVSVLQRWAQQDGPEADRWLARLPPGATKDAAMQSLAGH